MNNTTDGNGKKYIAIYSGDLFSTYIENDLEMVDMSEYVVIGFPKGNTLDEAKNDLQNHLARYYPAYTIQNLLSGTILYEITPTPIYY